MCTLTSEKPNGGKSSKPVYHGIDILFADVEYTIMVFDVLEDRVGASNVLQPQVKHTVTNTLDPFHFSDQITLKFLGQIITLRGR
ncbi:hypothetical protein BS17DRAFT_773275 [Gyrodon lividus]|nr:hypothetical protein BS17DRAFT_773275 [Gyrodon lividus]